MRDEKGEIMRKRVWVEVCLVDGKKEGSIRWIEEKRKLLIRSALCVGFGTELIRALCLVNMDEGCIWGRRNWERLDGCES